MSNRLPPDEPIDWQTWTLAALALLLVLVVVVIAANLNPALYQN